MLLVKLQLGSHDFISWLASEVKVSHNLSDNDCIILHLYY